MKTAARLLVSIALVAALVPALPGIASAHCGGYFTLETLRIEAQTTKKVYARGTVVSMKGTVTRPGERDPLQAGIEYGEPPVSLPVENADISADFWLGGRYLWDRDLTDADGKFAIKIFVPKTSKTGAPNVSMGAHVYYNQGGCPDGEENGYAYFPKMFKII